MTERDDDRGACDGCGTMVPCAELVECEFETQWCNTCLAKALVWDAGPLLAPEHRAPPMYDRIQEDDGDL